MQRQTVLFWMAGRHSAWQQAAMRRKGEPKNEEGEKKETKRAMITGRPKHGALRLESPSARRGRALPPRATARGHKCFVTRRALTTLTGKKGGIRRENNMQVPQRETATWLRLATPSFPLESTRRARPRGTMRHSRAKEEEGQPHSGQVMPWPGVSPAPLLSRSPETALPSRHCNAIVRAVTFSD